MLSRTALNSRPVLTGVAVLGVGVTAYYTTRRTPVSFDSAMKPAGVSPQVIPKMETAKKTFTSMLSSVQLKVASVEQVSHDTKKLTFELPSEDEISGLPMSGNTYHSSNLVIPH